MRRSLSSFSTIVPMVVLPIVLLAALVGSIFSPQANSMVPAVVVLVFLGVSLYFSWRLCFASTDGYRLYIYSYRGSDAIDLSEIKDVEAVSRSRTPRINLTFSTPSRLGSKIAIIPPFDFASENFWDVYELLSAHADNSKHDVVDKGNPRTSSSNRRLIVGIWLITVIVVVSFFVLKK